MKIETPTKIEGYVTWCSTYLTGNDNVVNAPILYDIIQGLAVVAYSLIEE